MDGIYLSILSQEMTAGFYNAGLLKSLGIERRRSWPGLLVGLKRARIWLQGRLTQAEEYQLKRRVKIRKHPGCIQRESYC